MGEVGKQDIASLTVFDGTWKWQVPHWLRTVRLRFTGLCSSHWTPGTVGGSGQCGRTPGAWEAIDDTDRARVASTFAAAHSSLRTLLAPMSSPITSARCSHPVGDVCSWHLHDSLNVKTGPRRHRMSRYLLGAPAARSKTVGGADWTGGQSAHRGMAQGSDGTARQQLVGEGHALELTMAEPHMRGAKHASGQWHREMPIVACEMRQKVRHPRDVSTETCMLGDEVRGSRNPCG
jgi:hypothetical protein